MVEASTDEREIVILLTPEVVAGVPKEMAQAYLPGTESQPPTDRELFLEGKIERRSSRPADRERLELKRRGLLRRYRRPGTALPEGVQLEGDAAHEPPPAPNNATPLSEKAANTTTQTSGQEPPRPLSLAGPSGFDQP